jgi:transcriptional regulator of acetoin/glycerol metabolism
MATTTPQSQARPQRRATDYEKNVGALEGLVRRLVRDEIAAINRGEPPSGPAERPSADEVNLAIRVCRDPAPLVRLLAAEEWNVARVARILGRTRRTIYLWLQRHEIQRRRPRKEPR